jgi:hypothetical protein
MKLTKEECVNAAEVLKQTQQALLNKDPLKLKDLSNRTIHSSCTFQDPGSTTTAVLIYALSKLIERDDYERIKNWDAFVKKFNALLDLAASAIQEQNQEAYERHLEKARKTLESTSINLKPYIQSVLRKASINKASKLYEHGISLEHTSKLLGVSQWELAEYASHKSQDSPLNTTLSVKQRAQMALEFFQ